VYQLQEETNFRTSTIQHDDLPYTTPPPTRLHTEKRRGVEIKGKVGKERAKSRLRVRVRRQAGTGQYRNVVRNKIVITFYSSLD
jgi:hypothetical protein